LNAFSHPPAKDPWRHLDDREASHWRADTWETARDAIEREMPASGLFAEKTWRISPVPFFLSEEFVEELEWLGRRLLAFYQAANQLYYWSVEGRMPGWIAAYLDRGKPCWLREAARDRRLRQALPPVIRPDLILTRTGYSIAELDSVPGGMGLTAWLNATYAGLGHEVVGGKSGMLEGFASILPTPDTAIAVSEESATYRPEMVWLSEQTVAHGIANPEVIDAESPFPANRDVYRFFELFDLPNLPGATQAVREAARGERTMISPPKPHLEEKLWLTLLWSAPLAEYWHQHLGARYFRDLRRVVPRGWVIDPAPLPHFAVLPGLDIHGWEALKQFSQRERELVLKVSGFSPDGWGSRSVVIGQDTPQAEWRTAVDRAVASFEKNPYILQRFAHSHLFEHPVEMAGGVDWMPGRVRMCPYYFLENGRAKLRGVLVTYCPPDKKILHGMRDAALIPAAVI